MSRRKPERDADGDAQPEAEAPAKPARARSKRGKKRRAPEPGMVDTDVAYSQAQADEQEEAEFSVSPSPEADKTDTNYLPKDDHDSDAETEGKSGKQHKSSSENDGEDTDTEVELIVRGSTWKEGTRYTINVDSDSLTPSGLVSAIREQNGLSDVNSNDVFLLPAVDRKNYGLIALSQAAIDKQLSSMDVKNQSLRKGAKPYVLRVGVVHGKSAAAEAKESKKREKEAKTTEAKRKSKAAKAKDTEHEQHLNQLIQIHGIHPFGGRYSQAKLQQWAEAIVTGEATLTKPPKGLLPDNLSKDERLAKTVASAVSDAIDAHAHAHSPPPLVSLSHAHAPSHSHAHTQRSASSACPAPDSESRAQSPPARPASRVKREPSQPPPAREVIFRVGGSNSFPTPAAVPMSTTATLHDLLKAVLATHVQLGADAQEAFVLGIGVPSGHVLSPTTPLSLLVDAGGQQREPLTFIERSHDLTITAIDQSAVIPTATTTVSVPFASLARQSLVDLLQHLAASVLPAGRPLFAAALADGTNINALFWHPANVLVTQRWHNLAMWY